MMNQCFLCREKASHQHSISVVFDGVQQWVGVILTCHFHSRIINMRLEKTRKEYMPL